MTLFHVDASDPGPFEDDLKQAIQRGSMIMPTGANWAGRKSWVKSALKNAGFPSATVFWPTSGASILGVDFWEHDIAIKAIAYFNERNIDGNKLTPEFHQSTPPEYTQKLAKASDSLPAPSDKLDLPVAPSDVVNLKAQMGNLMVEATRETQTLTRAQRQALRFGRTMQPELNPEWPESWAYNPLDPTAHHVNMMRDREADERRHPGGTVFNKEGPTTQFYARQFSPNDGNVEVAFTKPTSDGGDTTLIKYVELGSEEEATARAEGYTPFVVGELPIKFDDKMRDPRRCEVPMDVLTPKAPHEDIGRFFPRAIEVYSRQFGGIPSPYGLVKIEGQKLVPTPEQAKACVSFYKPENEGDPKYLDNAEAHKRKLVVTSRGFVIPYPRGSLNGVGRGEFDKFTEWQLQGRKVEVDMLDKDSAFEKRSTRPLCFVSPAGGPQREPIVVNETLGNAEEVYELGQGGEQTKTLSELLTSKRKRTETRGEIYGRGRARRRGGRGGRGGQGNGWP